MKISLGNSKVVAYHGGNGFADNFDLKFSGTGEGYRILGPGIYFVNNKYIATKYTQHAHTNPTVYTVEIDTTNFYIAGKKQSDAIFAAFDKIAVEIGLKSWEDFKMPRNSLKNGRGSIGFVVEQVGHKRALELFQKYGIKGAMEHIIPEEDVWEYCVFDLAAVKIIDRQLHTI